MEVVPWLATGGGLLIILDSILLFTAVLRLVEIRDALNQIIEESWRQDTVEPKNAESLLLEKLNHTLVRTYANPSNDR